MTGTPTASALPEVSFAKDAQTFIVAGAAGADSGQDPLQRPWHLLYFLPDPHQHGSLRPTLLAAPRPLTPEVAPTGNRGWPTGAPLKPGLRAPSRTPGPLSTTFPSNGEG